MKQKYQFVLKNIVPSQINEKYSFQIFNNVGKTSMTELEESVETTSSISFVDENKNFVKGMLVNIFQYSSREKKYNCFWDRNPIPEGVKIISCPLRYVADKAVKNFYSEASKITYTIRENVGKNKKILNDSASSIIIEKNDFYETTGMFCSFNCCMAYIKDNKNNPLFEMSEMLLTNIYNEITGDVASESVSSSIISPAPDWRLLNEYGGVLTIEKFRDSFGKVEYKDAGIFMRVPLCRIFQENIKM